MEEDKNKFKLFKILQKSFSLNMKSFIINQS